MRVGEQILVFRLGGHPLPLLVGLNRSGGDEGGSQHCLRVVAQPLCVLLGIVADLGGHCDRLFCWPGSAGLPAGSLGFNVVMATPSKSSVVLEPPSSIALATACLIKS